MRTTRSEPGRRCTGRESNVCCLFFTSVLLDDSFMFLRLNLLGGRAPHPTTAHDSAFLHVIIGKWWPRALPGARPTTVASHSWRCGRETM